MNKEQKLSTYFARATVGCFAIAEILIELAGHRSSSKHRADGGYIALTFLRRFWLDLQKSFEK